MLDLTLNSNGEKRSNKKSSLTELDEIDNMEVQSNDTNEVDSPSSKSGPIAVGRNTRSKNYDMNNEKGDDFLSTAAHHHPNVLEGDTMNDNELEHDETQQDAEINDLIESGEAHHNSSNERVQELHEIKSVKGENTIFIQNENHDYEKKERNLYEQLYKDNHSNTYKAAIKCNEQVKKETDIIKEEDSLHIEKTEPKVKEELQGNESNEAVGNGYRNITESVLKNLLEDRNNKDSSEDQSRAIQLLNNLLHLKNDESLNNHLTAILNEEKKFANDDNVSKEFSTSPCNIVMSRMASNEVSSTKEMNYNKMIVTKENSMKLKTLCLGYLRVLKRLTTSWSDTNETFEYHFVNLLNKANEEMLENYLCCFSNLKIHFMKNTFMDSIIECIEELEIMRKLKIAKEQDSTLSMEDNNSTNGMSKSEFHKKILAEVESNITRETIEEIHQLSMDNPYCSNYNLNKSSSGEYDNSLQNILNGTHKNDGGNSSAHMRNGSNSHVENRKDKDSFNRNHNTANSLHMIGGNCGRNQSNHSCSSHTFNCSGCNTGGLSSNCMNQRSMNAGIGGDHLHRGNEHKLFTGDRSTLGGLNDSNKTKGGEYSDENILNKLNVSIDYNTLHDCTNDHYIKEAEKVVEKYKSSIKHGTKDPDGTSYNVGSNLNSQELNPNLNSFLQFKKLFTEYENACKNDKNKLKDMDLNMNDLNFLKYLSARLNSGSMMDDKIGRDIHGMDGDLRDLKKGLLDSGFSKIEIANNTELEKLIPNFKANDDDTYDSRGDKRGGGLHCNDNQFNVLANNVHNLMKKRKSYEAIRNANGGAGNNSNFEFNYLLLYNPGIFKKMKSSFLEQTKNGGGGIGSVYDENRNSTYSLDHSNSILNGSNPNCLNDMNAKKALMCKNNFLNNIKNLKDLMSYTQDNVNRKSSSINASTGDSINPCLLYDFLLNNHANSTTSSYPNNGKKMNSVSYDASVPAISTRNSINMNTMNGLTNYGLNHLNSVSSAMNNNFNRQRRSHHYDFSADLYSKMSGNNSELSSINQDDIINNVKEVSGGYTKGVKNESKHSSGLHVGKSSKGVTSTHSSSSSLAQRNSDLNGGLSNGGGGGGGGGVAGKSGHASHGAASTGSGAGTSKLKYEMPPGVNPNDDKVRGVYFSKSPRGVGKWNAYFQIGNNKRLFTSFSVSKYGYNEARKLSIMKRTEWEREYQFQGDQVKDSKKGKRKGATSTGNEILHTSNGLGTRSGTRGNTHQDGGTTSSYGNDTKDSRMKNDSGINIGDGSLMNDPINFNISKELNEQLASSRRVHKINFGMNNSYGKNENMNYGTASLMEKDHRQYESNEVEGNHSKRHSNTRMSMNNSYNEDIFSGNNSNGVHKNTQNTNITMQSNSSQNIIDSINDSKISQ